MNLGVRMQKGVTITDLAYHLGPLVESNQDLLADNPGWDLAAIEAATGIMSRRIARADQCASDLAFEAAEELFAKGRVHRSQVDALIFCTQSPDYLLPTTACLLQERLKLSSACLAFDVNMGCSAYVYGLAMAWSFLKSGLSEKVLLLNADTYSKFVSRTDRTCRPLFGDGAAATLIEGVEDEDSLGPFDLGTDGRGWNKLILRGSGTRMIPLAGSASEVNGSNPASHYLEMDGAGILMSAMSIVPKTVEALLKKAGLGKNDVDLFIFHQASKKVLDSIVRRLDLPEQKVFRWFSDIGNTVSASIPIALKQVERQGRLHRGDRIMLVGFGVGFSWASCFMTWKGNGSGPSAFTAD